MNRLCLLLLPFLLLGLASAEAANIKQKDTGATVWVDSNGNEWPVGDTGLTIVISEISGALTDYVLSHRPGLITKIYVVPNSDGDSGISGSIFTFAVDLDADGNFTETGEAFGALHTLTATTAAGVPASLTISTGYTIGVGDVISIKSDGTSTGITTGSVTIVIE